MTVPTAGLANSKELTPAKALLLWDAMSTQGTWLFLSSGMLKVATTYISLAFYKSGFKIPFLIHLL